MYYNSHWDRRLMSHLDGYHEIITGVTGIGMVEVLLCTFTGVALTLTEMICFVI